MAKIKRDCLDHIKNTVSLYDVVSPYVNLKRAGSSWRGLSPFAQEKTPSFFVHPEKNLFKCFSSDLAGDMFRFIQLKENLNFTESVEFIARQFGIPVEWEKDFENAQEKSLRQELYELHDQASSVFHEAFFGSSELARQTQAYFFQERGFSKELAESFCIGFCSSQSGYLLKKWQKQFSQKALKASSLVFFYQDRVEGLRFENRLVIPIRDIQGRVIAFSARRLPFIKSQGFGADAKYLNSSESPIFLKGNLLFNLDRARKHVNKEQGFLLVEGPLDVLRCESVGIKQVIAPQGTGITEKQLRLLLGYTPCLTSFLDGDQAGQKAAFRLVSLALKVGLNLHFLNLPEQEDPDSFLKKKGQEGFMQLMKHQLPSMQWLLSYLSAGKDLDIETKQMLLREIYTILSVSDSHVLRTEYLKQACQFFEIDFQSAQNDFEKKRARDSKLSMVSSSQAKQHIPHKLSSAEGELLTLYLGDPYLGKLIYEKIPLDWIPEDSSEGQLLIRFLAAQNEGVEVTAGNRMSFVETEEERNLVYNLLLEDFGGDNKLDILNLSYKRLYKDFIKRKIINLQKQREEIMVSSATMADFSQQLLELRQALLQDLPPIQG